MAISYLVGTALDATTNPIPSSLSPVDPFGGLNLPKFRVSEDWTDQGVKAFFPNSTRSTTLNERDTMEFIIVPSGGDAVTYDVTIWYFNNVSRTWSKPKDNPTQSYTGTVQDEAAIKSNVPFYFQFSNISAGTLSLYINGNLVKAL